MSCFSTSISESSECVHSTAATDPSPAVPAADSYDFISDSSPPQMLQGIRNDLAEIGDSFKFGFSMLSRNSKKAVGEISRFASNLFIRSADGEDYEEFEDEFIDDSPGITDEVLDFVADISLRPEFWTQFPLPLHDTDFEMTEVQRKHTSIVEQLIPNISALKVQLQSLISNELFWMIYFVLVLPRFDQDDFELLATPEIVETLNLLQEKFRRKEKSQDDNSDNNLVYGTQNRNIQSEEKANSTEVTEGGGEGLEIQDGDEMNTNQRPKMEDSKTCKGAKERDGVEGNPFIDIEDDWTNLSGRFTNPSRTSSSTGSSDWVKLHEILDLNLKLDQLKTWKQDRDSEAEDLTEWLNMDEFYYKCGKKSPI